MEWDGGEYGDRDVVVLSVKGVGLCVRVEPRLGLVVELEVLGAGKCRALVEVTVVSELKWERRVGRVGFNSMSLPRVAAGLTCDGFGVKLLSLLLPTGSLGLYSTGPPNASNVVGRDRCMMSVLARSTRTSSALSLLSSDSVRECVFVAE